MSSDSFDSRVWKVCKRVPRGKVTTYKQIALALKTKAYRAVGNALNRNPYAPVVPCHRVVNSDGRVGGFAHGTARKIVMLRKEGIQIIGNKIKDFEKKLYKLK